MLRPPHALRSQTLPVWRRLRSALCCSLCLFVVLSLHATRALAQAEPRVPTQPSLPGHTPATLTRPPPTHEYWRVVTLGTEEFADGQWAEARALFLRAHRIWPSARSLRILGMTALNLHMYPTALRELSAALAEPHRRLSGPLRHEVQELLDRVQTFVGVYRLHLSPEKLSLRVDGLPTEREPDGTLLLAVGSRSLEAEAPGYVPLTRPLLVDGTDGETLRIALQRLADLPPRNGPAAAVLAPPVPWRQRVFKARRFTWLFGASGLVLAGVSGALAVEVAAEQERLLRQCNEKCVPEDNETARRDRLHGWSNGLLGGAVLLTSTALVLFLIDELREQ
jgi:hypothetical protein